MPVSGLQDTLPRLQSAESKLRQLAAQRGIVYAIADFGGLRTAADTARLVVWRDEAVARGEPSYRVAAADKSKHNAGAAFDVKIISTPPGMSVDTGYRTLGQLAASAGLAWGGKFSSPADPYHFELPESIATLSAEFARLVAAGRVGIPTPLPASATPQGKPPVSLASFAFNSPAFAAALPVIALAVCAVVAVRLFSDTGE